MRGLAWLGYRLRVRLTQFLFPYAMLTNQEGITRLFWAAMKGRTKDIIRYIAEGDNVNAVERTEGVTPLHCALYYNQMEAVRILIHYDANLNKPDHFGITPLHVANQKRLLIPVLQAAESRNTFATIDNIKF